MWNYRIVHTDYECYELCEVYYDKEGNPWSHTLDSSIVGETPEEVIDTLLMMLQDAIKNKVVLEVEDFITSPGDI